ncbi:hypothetical protein [Marilutibacter chinensis]|uniref:Lipoprotein n=1 Tax=Marilutibacter chinensis TaxID=2912247 RepID=A0ABS9I023_9GAMM|nr:hypothetical protein [Lysobacter chinensis]MCF7223790.1 hypothetical protein [Lysobacter chinensis]
MKRFLSLVAVVTLLGCVAAPLPMQSRVQGENVLTVAPGDSWTVVEFNESGESVRTLGLELTSEPAETCISGDWRKVKVVSDPARYTRDPAYIVSVNRIEILLNTSLCDAYDSYIFDKDANFGLGEHVAYGMFGGKTLGRVVAYRTK